jgi:2-C-methyl-D-erythritol 2,4-cyclodiphosphate synthase
MRIGHGFDVHRLVPGRPLIIGGVTIPWHLGLLGHSDADVLLHAICDAILGALGLGDLGKHFPDSDPAFKGIDSMLLLEQAIALAAARDYIVGNLDATVVAQQPKLAPHIPAMVARIAATCRVDDGRINVKATTTEQLGYTGRGEGIAAHAVVLLKRTGEARPTF